MSDQANLSSSFIQALIRYLDERQIAAPLLRDRLTQFSKQPCIAHQDFAGLLRQIYEVDPVPALGMRIGRLAKPQDFGLVGYLLTSCATLGQALIRYGRFQPLVLSTLKAKVRVKDNTVEHTWSLGDVSDPLAIEFNVSVFVSLYQSLIGKVTAPVRVGLPFSNPDNREIYQAILGCPVEFNAPGLCVDIPAPLLLMTISSSDPYLRKIFDQQAEAMLEQTSKANESFETFLHALQQELLVAMKEGDTRASTVAKTMGYSLRSFYRKLSEQGYSYRTILSDLRRRLAKKYLADTTLSPSDVAMLLGYSEQSAFIRAFKGWMGMTPGEFRNNLPK